ncbi:MAG TPA: 30S ribosomal protein S12 methylthiotransferase RimO [Firmicutes bacterium]|nr:30S ribosomal protein S12 methylthiotransferase RimO [Bacillota bacterium]
MKNGIGEKTDDRVPVAIVSLGCPKNTVDSEAMAHLLKQHGFETVVEPRQAEVIIVNTCGFIAPAREESISVIRRMARLKQRHGRALVVAGCLAQRLGDELLQIPGVDAVLGTGELERLPEVVRECLCGTTRGRAWVRDPEVPLGLPRLLSTGATAYLKIGEGCDRRCSFCIIPRLRGRYRSRPLPDVVAEAQGLVDAGARELVLVAEDTSRYGEDLYGKPMLAPLLEALASASGARWIRVLYAYPHGFTEDAARVMAEQETVVPYVDLPLQHISDGVLRRMGRPDRGDDIRRFLDRLRQMVPGIVLRSTFLLGFPGESEADFRELLEFLRTYQLDHAGFFTFYPEPEAPAAAYPEQVPEEAKRRRWEEAVACQAGVSLALNRRLLGRELEILVEASSQVRVLSMRGTGDRAAVGKRWLPEAVGRWAGQAPEVDGQVHVPGSRAQPGEFIRVRVEQAFAHDLVVVPMAD